MIKNPKLICCEKEVELLFSEEGGMANRDGSIQYEGICEVCGQSYFLTYFENDNDDVELVEKDVE